MGPDTFEAVPDAIPELGRRSVLTRRRLARLWPGLAALGASLALGLAIYGDLLAPNQATRGNGLLALVLVMPILPLVADVRIG